MSLKAIRAKKKFGQNFLKDDYYLNRIVESIPKDASYIVEIGAGLGDLTKYLLQIAQVLAIEIDKDLYKFLKQKFTTELTKGNLEIVLADAKDYQFQCFYAMVANLPYYTATRLILKALKDPLCQYLVVMTQYEVAVKFCAQAGDRSFCALSVLSQYMGQVQFLFEVPNIAFYPQPKVRSAVWIIKKNRQSYEEGFSIFLRTAFAQPRKTVFKNLSVLYDKTVLQKSFVELGIEFKVRAHQINTAVLLSLYHLIKH